MARIEVGSRVGAILKADKETVHLLGYGVYDGEQEPPFGPMGIPKEKHDAITAGMKREGKLPMDYVFTNPRITLDDGRVVWGAHCWWGTEEQVKAACQGRTVIMATVEA